MTLDRQVPAIFDCLSLATAYYWILDWYKFLHPVRQCRTIHCYNEHKASQSTHSGRIVLGSGKVDRTSHRCNHRMCTPYLGKGLCLNLSLELILDLCLIARLVMILQVVLLDMGIARGMEQARKW